MGLCGVAVPNGYLKSGLPQGITLLAPPFREAYLSAIGKAYHEALDLQLGATATKLRAITEVQPTLRV